MFCMFQRSVVVIAPHLLSFGRQAGRQEAGHSSATVGGTRFFVICSLHELCCNHDWAEYDFPFQPRESISIVSSRIDCGQ